MELTARNPRPVWLQRNLAALIFFVAFVVMTLTSVEQARIIDSQRLLIRQLFSDSIALNDMRVEQVKNRYEQESRR